MNKMSLFLFLAVAIGACLGVILAALIIKDQVSASLSGITEPLSGVQRGLAGLGIK